MDRTFRRLGFPPPNNGQHRAPSRPTAIPSDGIPIIGQPFQVKGGFPTVQIQCSCDAREPILLIGNGHSQCPHCHRAFTIATFQFVAQTGQIQVAIQHGTPADTEPEPEIPPTEEQPS